MEVDRNDFFKDGDRVGTILGSLFGFTEGPLLCNMVGEFVDGTEVGRKVGKRFESCIGFADGVVETLVGFMEGFLVGRGQRLDGPNVTGLLEGEILGLMEECMTLTTTTYIR